MIMASNCCFWTSSTWTSGSSRTLFAQISAFWSFFSTLHNFTSIPPRRKTSTVATTSRSSEPLATKTSAFFPLLLAEREIQIKRSFTSLKFDQVASLFFYVSRQGIILFAPQRYIDTHTHAHEHAHKQREREGEKERKCTKRRKYKLS